MKSSDRTPPLVSSDRILRAADTLPSDTSFGSDSVALCNLLAAVACYFCIHNVYSTELMAFVACRLIPLDKKPRVQPIGVGDVPRLIIAKAILHVIGDDIQLAAGALQTCAGHDAGSEAAIHAMKSIFDDDNTHAALLVDATVAFNLVISLSSFA